MSATLPAMTTEDIVGLAPVIPVVVIDDLDHAVPLASALVRGGLPAIEVTLRTPAALAAIERIAAGDPSAGPIARLSIAERFHWLTSPSSTVIQPSEVHTGLCEDPAAELDHLFERLVR